MQIKLNDGTNNPDNFRSIWKIEKEDFLDNYLKFSGYSII